MTIGRDSQPDIVMAGDDEAKAISAYRGTMRLLT